MSDGRIASGVAHPGSSSAKLLTILAAASLAVVILQVSTAGMSALVDPAFARWHSLGGKLGSVVIVATALVAWIAGRDKGVTTSALLLFVTYHLQAVWLLAGRWEGLFWLRGAHAPNALLVFYLAYRLYRSSSTR